MTTGLRGNFLTGLVVVLPVGLTLWLMWTFVGWIDSIVLPVVPDRLLPGEYVAFDFRGIGVAFFLLFTLAIGWFAKGWAGRSLIRATESAVSRTPLVRSIYGGVKQIAEALVGQTDSSFDTVCLVEFPRPGIWALAFVARAAKGELAEAIKGYDPPAAVFLPTTPNPTTGFLLFVPRSRVIELRMTLEEGVKLIMSGGLVQPHAGGEALDASLAGAETEAEIRVPAGPAAPGRDEHKEPD